MKSIEEMVQELFLEASNGVVYAGEWRYFLRFYNNIEGVSNAKNNKFPIVNIPSYNSFIETLKSYLNVAYDFYYDEKDYFMLNDEAYLKRLVINLFVNATNYDLLNMDEYIENREKMLTNKVKEGEFVLGQYLNNTKIISNIVRNRSNEEAPYSFKVAIKDDQDTFMLPEVVFSIVDNKVYVMAIQNKVNEKQDNPLAKKMDRYFRKVNKGIDESEDIYKVSPNALVSMTIFNTFLMNTGITQVEANNFMPIRYHGKKIMLMNKYKQDDNLQKEAYEKHNFNQYNITNKFMNLIRRYCHHFNKCEYEYDDIKQVMICKLNKGIYNDDNIIFDIEKCVSNKYIKK